MSDDYLTKEAKARFERIDPALVAAGWVVQRFKKMNLGAADAIAVREFPTPSGPVDYLLYVDGKAIGTLEAKKEGVTLGSVEPQSRRYSKSFQEAAEEKGYPHWALPLPFHYSSTGYETAFIDLRDPAPRPRDVFSFHTPATLRKWAEADTTFRQRLKNFPALDPSGLRPVQVTAITALESSYAIAKPKALVHMTVGSGKTYVAVASSYRLLKDAGAERILFIVDRKNLGKQAFDEFNNYVLPGDGRKFGDVYNIQLLRSNTVSPASSVVITTLQRLYSILRGDPEMPSEELEDESLYEIEAGQGDSTPVEVAYNAKVPLELFDLIWIDEAHRSIYGKYGQVLDYFDAFKNGLTATPSTFTYGYFDGNVVTEYTYEESVIDNVNVDFSVYRIKTEKTESGTTIAKGETVKVRDRYTRQQAYRELDDELVVGAEKLDRDVVIPDQIRTVVRTFRDKVTSEIFPGRAEVPKTVFFCKDDNHAEDVLKIIREEFGGSWDFARKITYKSEGNTDEHIRDFRNDPRFRIAVTVDQVSTGTDIRPLECLVFMRLVQSRTLFEQMKGRGVRTIDPTDLQAVTGSAELKDRFVIVDCVGVTDEDRAWAETKPLDREPTVPLPQLLQQVAMGITKPDLLTTVASRLSRLSNRLDDEQRNAITEKLGGSTLTEIAQDLIQAADPDFIALTAHEELGREATEEEAKVVGTRLAKEALAPLQDAAARDAIATAQRRLEQIIDIAGKDELLFAGPVDRSEAEQVVQTFKQFIEENHDEFVALKAYYGTPVKSRLSLADVKKLAEAIKAPPYLLTPAKVWQAYEKLENSKVTSGGSIPADLVSLLRFTLGAADELVPFPEVVRLRYDIWLAEQGGSERFTPKQLRWLEMVRDHMEESLTIETEDFDLDPFAQAGGIVAAYDAFGDQLPAILEQLNEALLVE